MLHTPKYIALNIKQFPTSAGGIFRGDVLTTETHGTTRNHDIYSPLPLARNPNYLNHVSCF